MRYRKLEWRVASGSQAILVGWLVLALVCFGAAQAQHDSLVVDGTIPNVSVTPYLHVLEDASGKLDGETVLARDLEVGFEPLGNRASNFGLTTSAWWVRFVVSNPQAARADMVLRQNYPLIDHLDVWVTRDGTAPENWRTGDRTPFSSRPIQHRDFLFPISLEPGETRTVYLRFASEGPVNVGLSLYTQGAILGSVALEHLAFGAYFGGFVLLAVSILLLYLLGRDRAFLYYLCYILSYASYMAQFNGLAYQFLWPESPDFSSVSQVVLLSSSLFFLLQFCRTLLDIPNVSRPINVLSMILQGVVVACLLVAPFVSYGLLMKPLVPATLIANLLVIAMGIAAHRAGQRAARFYLLAWSVYLIGVIAYVLKTVGLLPHNFFTQYGFQIGSFFEFVLLSVALGIRVQELRRQSQTDALTGLPNRGTFDTLIRDEWERARATGSQLAVLVLDVDHFKRFNDTYGHVAGDRVLREVADILLGEIRRPGRGCRYGGEEFAAVLPGAGPEDALIQAEHLRSTVQDRLSEDRVTISVGVANTQRGQFNDPESMFTAADEALYEAKRRGRNRVEAAWAFTTISDDSPTTSRSTA